MKAYNLSSLGLSALNFPSLRGLALLIFLSVFGVL